MTDEFSVLPPPPRYPTQHAYAAAAANGMAVPTMETNNTLGHPTGSDYQLVVGEGNATVDEHDADLNHLARNICTSR